MKTPMQQMLELLEELLDSKPTRADRTRFETAISKAKELIEEERDIIEEAFEEGHLTAHHHECPPSFVIPGSVYYDKLYTDIYKEEEK